MKSRSLPLLLFIDPMESIYGGKIDESFSWLTGFVEQGINDFTTVLVQERSTLSALISAIIQKLMITSNNYIEADSGEMKV
jgi:hypothetical protein